MGLIMNDLENCPCCNSNNIGNIRAVNNGSGEVTWRVYCKNCQVRTGPESSKANAISIWQQRKYKWEKKE